MAAQIVQVGVGEGHVVHAGEAVDMLLGARETEHGDAVVLAIIGDEPEMLGLEHRFGLEHRLVPVEHEFDALRWRFQHHMGELRRRDLAALFRCLRQFCRCNTSVHRISPSACRSNSSCGVVAVAGPDFQLPSGDRPSNLRQPIEAGEGGLW